MDLGAQDQQKNPKSKGLQWDLRTLELDLRFRGGLGLSPIGLENFRGGFSPSPSPTSAIASLDLDVDFGDLSGVSGWVGTSCNFSSSTPRPSSSTPRLRLGVLELGLSVLERSRPSTPPPAVVLIPKFYPLRIQLHPKNIECQLL